MSDDERTDGEWSRLLAQDFGRYSFGMAVPAILELAAVYLFTRLFAPDAYGRYALVFVVATVAVSITSGWIRQAILRFGPETGERRLVGTALAGTVAVTVIVGGLGGVGYLLLEQRLGPYRPFYVAGLALVATKGGFATVRTLFQSQLHATVATVGRVVQAVATFAAAILLAVFVLDHLVGWVWGAAVGSMVATAVLLARGPGLGSLRRADTRLLGRMVRFGFPMVGWLLATSLLTFADRAMLELFSGSAAVGIYASNYDLAMRGLALLFAPFIQAAHPILMNAWDGDNPAEIRRLLTRFTRYFLIVGALATAYAIVLSRPLSELALGAGFREGFVVIPLVAAGQFLWYAAMVGHKGFEVREQTDLMFLGVAATLVVNLVLNVPLILQFGYLGAALATFLSYGVYAAFVFRVSRRAIEWRLPRGTVRNVLVATATFVGPVAVLSVAGGYSLAAAAVVSVIGGPVYVVALYGLGEIRADELETGRRLLRRVPRSLGAGDA